MSEVAQRAVSCKGWRWLPGMRTSTGVRVLRIEEDGYTIGWQEKAGHIWTVGPEHVPDLADPATLGCMLALVRQAWEDRRGSDYVASTFQARTGWGVGAKYGSEGMSVLVLPVFAFEGEALVAALEKTP